MPQDHSHSETSHAHHTRGESRRGERTRGDKAPAGRAMSAPFGEVGVLSLTTGLRLQQEMLDVLQDLGSEWLARAPSQVELALNLPNRLTAARSIADALSVYRGWLGECMTMVGEDSSRLDAYRRKIIDTGVRCLGEVAPRV